MVNLRPRSSPRSTPPAPPAPPAPDEGETLEELAQVLSQPGPHKTNGAQLLRTVAEYNEAAAAGTTSELEVPRELGTIAPIEGGPYHAFPMTVSVYFPYGGIAVDERAQVLNTNHQPIPGLYASAPAAGGFMREIYTGAIGCAGVTGRWAGKAAAEDLLAK